MKEQISKPLKILFLIHFFVSIIFALIFIIIPKLHNDIVDWGYWDPIASRAFGAALAGFAASSLLAWRETEWIRVKIITQVEIAWITVGIGIMIVSIIYDSPSAILYLYLAIFIVFLGAFSWFYFQHER